MATRSVLWKPISSGAINRGGASFLLPENSSGYKGVSIVDKAGKVIDTLSTRHSSGQAGAWKYYTQKPGGAYGKDVYAKVDYSDGASKYFSIGDASKRLGYNYDSDTLEGGDDIGSAIGLNVDDAAKYSGGSSYPEGYIPGMAGQYGFYPANLEELFPSASLVKYKRMKSAPYNFTDPMEFAEEYGDFNREQYSKNIDMAKEFSLDALNTELEALQSYVPAAASLKRSETALDNIFNQSQRTRQVESTMPGVTKSLESQASRAETYARGGVPDDISNQALELGIRSSAADQATAGGFGATSSVARKASDLMSAAQRLQIAQYGENLLTQNVGTRANLLLAPTEYSNAGTQISVNPTVSPAQLQSAYLSDINQYSMISPTTALQSQVQQQQFVTSQKQQTRMFNTGNAFSAEQINANAQNQFKMNKFQYQAGFAAAVAGAAQTDSNTALQMELADKYYDIYKDSKDATQSANNIQSVISGIGSVISAGSQLVSAFSGLGKRNTSSDTGSSQVLTSDEGGYQYDVASTSPETNVSSGADQGGYTTSGTRESIDVGLGGTTAADAIQDSIGLSSGGGESYGTSASYMDYSSGNIGGVSTQAASFSADTGYSIPASSNNEVTKALLSSSAVPLNQAGLSTESFAGSIPVGTNTMGQRVYSDPALAASTDTSGGSRITAALTSVLDPMGALTKDDATALDAIGSVASDTALLASLTAAYQNKDSKAFTNILTNALKQPVINSATDDFQTRQGLSAAFNAYNLFANWGNMSAAQKSLSVATAGIQGFNTVSGENLWQSNIIDPVTDAAGNVITPGLNVSQAMSLLGTGVNVYGMVKNWDQMSTMSRVASGTSNLSNMITVANKFGLLGKGTSNAAVAVTASDIASSGASLAPTYGIGAITAPSAANLPAGYTAVASGGQGVIAVPQGLEASAKAFTEVGSAAATAETSTMSNLVGGATLAAGAVSVGMGAKTIMDSWGEGGKSGRLQGAIGGSSMALGLYAMGSSSLVSGTAFAAAATNPFVLAGVVAASFAASAIKTGKSESQMKRDAVRGVIKKSGLADSDYNVTLADGSKASIGIDGHGGYHEARYSDQINWKEGGKNGKLQSFDIDYTNDLDYASGMGGMTLSRLLTGGSATNIDQIGGQLGNAAISNIGYGKDMTEDNFNKMAANMRSFYAKSGINSKVDGYALVKQAYADGRLDDTQAVAAHQTLDFLFDSDGYIKCKSLMAGRQAGTAAAKVESSAIETDNAKAPSKVRESLIDKVAEKFIPYSQAKIKNTSYQGKPTTQTKEEYSFSPMTSSNTRGMTEKMKKALTAPASLGYKKSFNARKRAELMNLTRAEAQRKNRSIYGAPING